LISIILNCRVNWTTWDTKDFYKDWPYGSLQSNESQIKNLVEDNICVGYEHSGYNVMLFWLTNALVISIWWTNFFCKYFNDFIVIYLDDILIFFKDKKTIWISCMYLKSYKSPNYTQNKINVFSINLQLNFWIYHSSDQWNPIGSPNDSNYYWL